MKVEDRKKPQDENIMYALFHRATIKNSNKRKHPVLTAQLNSMKSTPSLSTSCEVHPCNILYHCPLLQFQSTHIIKVRLHHYVPIVVGNVSQEVVCCRLKLRTKRELFHDTLANVAEVFPRLEKPDDTHVARDLVESLELTVVPGNQCYFSSNNLRERKR